MASKFQQQLPKDIDTLWEIVKIWHPEIPDTWETKRSGIMSVKENKLNPYCKYSWVCIDFRLAGYGQVSIGIDNGNNYSLYGPRTTKDDIRQAMAKGLITIRTWRFSLDKLSREDESQDEVNNQRTTELLKQKGYTIQSVDEFFDDYYSD